MPSPVKIACMGEVMIELIAGKERQATIGVAGDTYNTAVYLSKLIKNSDIEVSYVTALGTDHFSKRIFCEIEKHGINTGYIEHRPNHMPGLYAIDTDEYGERSFSYWREQSADRTLFQTPCNLKPEFLSGFDLIYLSGISMAILPAETRSILIEFLTSYRKSGGKLVFDSNYRPRLWEDTQTARDITKAMWSLTDIALPSLDDELALFGESSETAVLTRLETAGVRYGALKRGAEGPLAIGEKTNFENLGKIANVVDSTAAGDSFNAGFLHQHILSGDLAGAIISGHELASKVVQKSGAIIELE